MEEKEGGQALKSCPALSGKSFTTQNRLNIHIISIQPYPAHSPMVSFSVFLQNYLHIANKLLAQRKYFG